MCMISYQISKRFFIVTVKLIAQNKMGTINLTERRKIIFYSRKQYCGLVFFSSQGYCLDDSGVNGLLQTGTVPI